MGRVNISFHERANISTQMVFPRPHELNVTKASVSRVSVNTISQYVNPRGGGGYLGFQVTGMIEGFFLGLKFSIPVSFGWLDLSRDFWGGIKKNW